MISLQEALTDEAEFQDRVVSEVDAAHYLVAAPPTRFAACTIAARDLLA